MAGQGLCEVTEARQLLVQGCPRLCPESSRPRPPPHPHTHLKAHNLIVYRHPLRIPHPQRGALHQGQAVLGAGGPTCQCILKGAWGVEWK